VYGDFSGEKKRTPKADRPSTNGSPDAVPMVVCGLILRVQVHLIGGIPSENRPTLVAATYLAESSIGSYSNIAEIFNKHTNRRVSALFHWHLKTPFALSEVPSY